MYLGLDGSGVPVRPAEVEGRAGKQPDGSAKTREVKLATVWTAEGRDKTGRPVRDRGSVSYNRPGREPGQPRHRPASPLAGRLRKTGLSRGNAAPCRHRGPSGRPSATARHGFGTSPPSSFPAPSTSLTSTTPSSIYATWPRPSHLEEPRTGDSRRVR